MPYTAQTGKYSMGQGRLNQPYQPTDWSKQKNPYGKNPYQGFQKQVGSYGAKVGGYGSQMMDRLMGSPFFGGGGGGSSTSGWSMGYPPPNDPTVAAYQQQILGQQRSDLADYTKQAYGRNWRGMRSAGGPDAQSALHQQAIDRLARMRAGTYDQAMGYGRDYYGAGAENARYMGQLASSLFGQELGGLGLGLQGRQAEQARYGQMGDWERQNLMDQQGENRYGYQAGYQQANQGQADLMNQLKMQWLMQDRQRAQGLADQQERYKQYSAGLLDTPGGGGGETPYGHKAMQYLLGPRYGRL